jgi:hypothetical protein
MITFERMSIWEWILGWLFLRRHYRRQQELAAKIRYLVEHPEEPCSIEGIIVPDGYGRETK